MRKLATILLLLITLSAQSQIVNKFRDSTWFAKGVRFDSAIYLIKGASNGKVLTSDANGRATWQTFSGSGVTQSTLNDSISAVRSIRKVDTLYRNLDSLVFKINGIRYAIIDSSGGGGGSQDLQQTLTNGNTTGGQNISISNGDAIILDNGSMLKKGTIDAGLGGVNGIAQICAVGYELKWEAGRLYVMGGNGNTIRQSLYNFTTTPTVNDDNLKGYGIGSLWTLDDNTTYLCTDATTANAVWSLINDSIYFNRTYSQLRAQMSAHTLVKGATYKLTDFATIYDQSLSAVTKTASGEVIVLVANSDSTFSPIVSSLDFPTDIIHYDITIDTTYINGAPCKGKITYRKDANGNSTYFDFRKVLMLNYNDLTEQLFFDLSKLITGNDMPFTKEYGLSFGIDAIEFPASFFKDNVYQNSNNYFAASYFNGEVTQNTGNVVLASNFNGEFSQNFELRIIECVFDSILIYSGEGSWSNSIFHSAVNKVVSTNFNNTEVDGLIDRIFQSGYLYDTIQGRLYWCVGIYMYGCNIDGDFSGVNECAWVQTRSNCNVETINGISHQSEKIGFKDCTITGTSGSSDFGNIRIDCLVESKIISEALYPELFDTSYAKTIFKGSNGSVYYTYYNGLTYVINEII
jgi:hypothetical protein